jgi:hypothetical protein
MMSASVRRARADRSRSARLDELALVIAHVAGVPLEEVLPTLAGTSTGLLVVRAWLMLRRPRRRMP